MFDTIHIATSGLTGHQQGLRVIGNNVSNMNTTGFRASRVDFGDVFSTGHNGGDGGNANDPLGGSGLHSQSATLDLSAGEFKSTGRDLDIAVSGPGFFVVRTAEGKQLYTRSGDFEFNSQGILVMRGTENEVLALSDAELKRISLDGISTNAAKATTALTLRGNLSSTGTTHSIETLKVFDTLGAERTLKLVFTNKNSTPTASWDMTVTEGTETLGTGTFQFTGGIKDITSTPVSITLKTNGAPNTTITIDLASDATSFSTGTSSTLDLKTQDGYGMGQITNISFNDKGVLKFAYSNAQTIEGPTLALAKIRSPDVLSPQGDVLFEYVGTKAPEIVTAGNEITLILKTLEAANVDLSEQFSTLILMQRGYQASSQVLTTANEMLQQLFEMTGRK